MANVSLSGRSPTKTWQAAHLIGTYLRGLPRIGITSKRVCYFGVFGLSDLIGFGAASCAACLFLFPCVVCPSGCVDQPTQHVYQALRRQHQLEVSLAAEQASQLVELVPPCDHSPRNAWSPCWAALYPCFVFRASTGSSASLRRGVNAQRGLTQRSFRFCRTTREDLQTLFERLVLSYAACAVVS